MIETVELWIMGDFWKRDIVKWGREESNRKYISMPCGNCGLGGLKRYFIYEWFSPGCYTLIRISDYPHYMEGG